MTLASPSWLWWLPGVAVLAAAIVVGAWWQRRELRRLFSEAMWARIVPPLVRVRRVVRDVAALLGLALMLVSLAEPRFDKQIQTLSATGTDLVVLLDLSRSMDAQDVDPSRLERARREISDLGRLVEGDRVGLVVFAGASYARLPLTQDFRALELVISEAGTDSFETQGSDLAGALTEAKTLLDRSRDQAGQAILVLSDGETHDADAALDAAQSLAAVSIPVYAMGIGIEPSAIPLPNGRYLEHNGQVVRTAPDFRALEAVAQATGGAFVKSNASDRDMRDLYTEIRANVRSVERNVQKRETWRTGYQWPLSAAVALLLLASWIGDGRRLFGAAAVLVAFGLVAPQTSFAVDPKTLADERYQTGNYAEAVDLLTELSLQNPDDVDVLERLGAARYRASDFEGAARAFDDAARLSGEADAYFNAGNAHYKAGRLEQALDKYDRALSAEEGHPGAVHNQVVVQQEIEARRQPPPAPTPRCRVAGERRRARKLGCGGRREGSGQRGQHATAVRHIPGRGRVFGQRRAPRSGPGVGRRRTRGHRAREHDPSGGRNGRRCGAHHGRASPPSAGRH